MTSQGPSTTLEADVVILGSGFAAYEIARSVLGNERSCIVVERGGRSFSESDPDLSRVPFTREPIVSGGFDFGAQVPRAFDGVPRYIGIGGTSELWSGKWRRLDRLDVERELEGRRWLVPYDELGRYYDRVAPDYGWPDWSADPMDAVSAKLSQCDLRGIEIFEQAPPVRIGPKWAELEQDGALHLLADSEVAEPIADAGGQRLRAIRLRRRGLDTLVSARSFVVACGGIESVRVGHQLRAACAPALPLPTTYPGFMDHPKAVVGEVHGCTDLTLLEELRAVRDRQRRLVAFSLKEDAIGAARGGNHTVFVWPGENLRDPARLVINLEQLPEPENLIVASASGGVSWRLSQRTWADYEAFVDRLTPRIAVLFGGTVRVDPQPIFRGASHHAGALPMGESTSAQVDRHCRFHGTDNVYCASSAVFPLAGSANPTMTIVALARRLGDHLQGLSA